MTKKNLARALAFAFLIALILPAPATAQKESVKVKVKKLLLDPSSKTPVVVLESLKEKKFIPIWIGKAEATSIAMELEHVKIPRPNTHDLIGNIVKALGASLDRVTITDLKKNTYYAVLTLRLKGKKFEIDARPSDGIAIALRMGAPIFASSQLLAKAGKLPAGLDDPEGVRNILGFQIQDLTAELAAYFNLSTDGGVLVADVERGGTASKAGFQRGDVIIDFNGKSIKDVGQLESFLKGVKKPGKIKLKVQRNGRAQTVVMNLPF
ncbi:MAG: PDZ domain-containing protein [Deltaproteobacteria bacterium]|nr:PDZ domain-containing protein [Deltaproteobacteria bacterium]